MCGICGILDLERAPIDRSGVQAMLDGMLHRGPDSQGLYEAPGVVAGVRRLAVIDVAGGSQPISNEDGSVEVVFNGEIYNFADLRAELESRGHRFRTRSDTEVLVHLWEDDGPQMLHRLNGMFAFCLHDRRAGRTLLARDRMGIKPLYYHLRDGRLVFASELAVLLKHPEMRPEIDFDALLELFCLQYVSGDRTLYRGIKKLPPGAVLEVRDGRLEQRTWWEIPRDSAPEVDRRGIDEHAQELYGLLDSAVAYRTVSDVPLGLFLSGGLDSSALCALLSDHSDSPVQTFSVGFEDAAAFDERAHAHRVADAFGAQHREQVVSAVQIAERLPELIRHLRVPVTDPALLPTWSLSEFAREQVTVVLSGEGADELFAGYRRYAYQNRLGWLGSVPGVGALRGLAPRRIEQALEAVGEDRPARNHLLWASTVGLGLAGKLFDPQAVRGFADRVAGQFERYFQTSEVRLADQLRVDQSEWLPHNLLAKIDRAGMAHSLEARVPFLDHRVVEWAALLPTKFKLQGKTNKAVLRHAFRERLPESTLGRAKKGFDLPLADWIRGPLRGLAEETIHTTAGRWPELRAAGARTMLKEHLAGRQDHGLPLFLLVSVLTFLQEQP